jgi:hypothetical protein
LCCMMIVTANNVCCAEWRLFSTVIHMGHYFRFIVLFCITYPLWWQDMRLHMGRGIYVDLNSIDSGYISCHRDTFAQFPNHKFILIYKIYFLVTATDWHPWQNVYQSLMIEQALQLQINKYFTMRAILINAIICSSRVRHDMAQNSKIDSWTN